MGEAEKPSKEFLDAIIDSGSIAVQCGYCNKTLFASEREDWFEEGELETLRRKKLTHPKECKEYPDLDTIHFGTFMGRIIVPGCSLECDAKIASPESMVVAHRHPILKFLYARAKVIQKEAEDTIASLAPLCSRIK